MLSIEQCKTNINYNPECLARPGLAANDFFICSSKQNNSSLQLPDKTENSLDLLTYGEDRAEDRGVLHRGAVPPVVPELELALSDTIAGPATHVDHVVRVEHAELLLSGGQTFYPGSQTYVSGRWEEVLSKMQPNKLECTERLQENVQFYPGPWLARLTWSRVERWSPHWRGDIARDC